jgi:hypothetical protein
MEVGKNFCISAEERRSYEFGKEGPSFSWRIIHHSEKAQKSFVTTNVQVEGNINNKNIFLLSILTAYNN